MAVDKNDKIRKKPIIAQIPVRVWNCDDLKEMINRQIRAHVKDVELAKKLEHALGDEVAYNDGGGGGVGVA
jgi:hypothetical protein